MDDAQVHELLYQALETELGGVEVYNAAIECAVNDELREEWEKYLEETENHVRIVGKVFDDLDLDPGSRDPGTADRPPQGEGAGRVDADGRRVR